MCSNIPVCPNAQLLSLELIMDEHGKNVLFRLLKNEIRTPLWND